MIEVYRPEDLSKDTWASIQALQTEALAHDLPHRSTPEIEALLGADDFDRYVLSHADPNTEVGGRFVDGQSFNRARVALATNNEAIVGYAYSADNVSGSKEAQAFKRFTGRRNYLWLREVSVHPDYRRQGMASALGQTLLRGTLPWQPVSTYIWPEELPHLQPLLEGVGFMPTGEAQSRELFGIGTGEVATQRMQAASVRGVMRAIREQHIRRS